MAPTLFNFSNRQLMTVFVCTSYLYFAIRNLKLIKIYRLSAAKSSSSSRANATQDLNDGMHCNCDEQIDAHASVKKVQALICEDCMCNNEIVQTEIVSESSKLPNIDGLMRRLYALTMIVNVILVLKYMLLCSLTDYLRSYQYLDCFLPGRMMINGRLAPISNYLGAILTFFNLVWHLIIWLGEQEFRLDLIEFMSYETSELGQIFSKARRNSALDRLEKQMVVFGNQINGNINNNNSNSSHRYSKLMHMLSKTDASHYGHNKVSRLHDSILEYINPFDIQENNRFLARPNRTPASLAQLLSTVTFFLNMMVITSMILLPLNSYAITPVALTQRGFLLNNQNCIKWLAGDVERFEKYHYIHGIKLSSNITWTPIAIQGMIKDYLAEWEDDLVLPYKDFLPMNWFHIFRWLGDLVENITMYFLSTSVFVTPLLLSIVVAQDVRIYAKHVRRGMLEYIYQSCNIEDSRARCYYESKMPRSSGPWTVQNIDNSRRLVNLQAMTVDMLSVLGNYSNYASLITLFTISAWVLFSAIVSSWILAPGDGLFNKIKMEWYVVHVLATLCTFSAIGSFASVNTQCKKMYALTATIAGLDNEDIRRKERWSNLLKVFTPNSLLCFRVSKSIEISWLLVLKLTAWLLSAILVISSYLGV